MKKLSAILSLALVTGATSALAQFTNTLTITDASWNDGGSLNGYLTVAFDALGDPTSLVSADIVTGDSTPGYYPFDEQFLGYTYIYNVTGQDNTVGDWDFDLTQNGGAPANELNLSSSGDGGNYVNLDWQGSTTMTFFANANDFNEYSAEDYYDAPAFRTINDESGSVGETPEPASVSLTGLGGLAMLFLRRRSR